MVSKEQRRLEKDKKRALQRGKLEEAAEICHELGSMKFSELNFEDALEEYQEELELYTKRGDIKNMAIAHRRVGETLLELAQYVVAIDHHKLYLELATNCGDPLEVQRAWATIGRTYFTYSSAFDEDEVEDIGNRGSVLKKAENAYCKSLSCTENLKEKLSVREYAEMKARLLLNLALIFDQRKLMSKCSECLRRAIHLCKCNNLTEDLHRCQYSLASIYFSYGELVASNSKADQAVNSAKALKDKTNLTDALLLKAKVQLCIKDYCSAKHYAKKAFRRTLPAKRASTGDFLKNVIGICRISEELTKGTSLEKQFELLEKLADVLVDVGCFTPAIENYKSALALAQDLNKPQSKIATLYFSLAKTCADSKDYSSAVAYWRQEIQCNADNPKEICATLLEIAKVEEKQGLEVDQILSLYKEAFEFAQKSRHPSQQYATLEKTFSFEQRHGLATALETAEQMKAMTDFSDEENEISDQDDNSNFAETLIKDIKLAELSDFTDSDEDSSEKPEPGQRKRSGFQLRKNEKGETPLHRACISGNLKLVKKLVEQGHPVNPRDHSGWLPIHEAANYGFLPIMEYLVERGAWLNDPGGDFCGGVTPLHDAAVGGHLQLVRYLVCQGATKGAKTHSGETPLDCLRQWKREVESDLDSCTLSDCIRLEELLASADITQADTHTHSAERKQFFPKLAATTGWVIEEGDQKSTLDVEPHSLGGFENEETDLEVARGSQDYGNPLLSKDEMQNDWEDPNVVCNAYQSVIDNLRKKTTVLDTDIIPEFDDDPFHITDDWLIEDIPVTKSTTKKRKRTLEDFNYSRTTTKKANLKVQGSNSSSTPSHSHENSRDFPIVVDELIAANSSAERPHCLSVTVSICGESIAVPVTDPSLTFSWLEERTAQSYLATHGTKPRLTLLRQDGAVLAKQDLISSFPNTIINALVDSWEESSLLERFTKSCELLKITFTKAIESKISFADNSGLLEVSAGSVFSKLHLKPLLTAVRFQNNLKSLSLSEIRLPNDTTDALCKSLPTLVNLVQLGLRCCGLDCPKLVMITDALAQSQKSLQKSQIQEIDLSYNFFGSDCTHVLRTLLSHLPLLRSVNLSFCDLPSGIFRSKELVTTVRSLIFLGVLNVSGNPLAVRGVRDYLQCVSSNGLVCLDLSNTVTEPNLGKPLAEYLPLVGPSLKCLTLRGCALANSDVALIAGVLGDCLQLEEIDVSGNPDLTWSGLGVLLNSVKEHDLPLQNLLFLGCHTSGDFGLEESFKVLRLGQIKKVLLTDDSVNSDCALKLQEKWLSCFGHNASVTKDAFGSITLSRDF